MTVIPAKNITQETFPKIVEVIHAGGVICYPTETLYGLGASVYDKDAVTRIFQIKRRIINKPVLILISSPSMLGDITDTIPDTAQQLMDHYWPGPLTILFKMKGVFIKAAGKTLVGKHKKVGIRISSNPIAAKIVEMAGIPIVSTSANISQKPGSGSVRQIKEHFSDKIDLLIDDGDYRVANPSTIVDPYVRPVKIIREGRIPKDDILQLVHPTAS